MVIIFDYNADLVIIGLIIVLVRQGDESIVGYPEIGDDRLGVSYPSEMPYIITVAMTTVILDKWRLYSIIMPTLL